MQEPTGSDPQVAGDDRAADPPPPPRTATSGTSLPMRTVLVAVGSTSLALGVVGIVIPVLPTTPFLLLAAACYARASDRLYMWLLGQPALGPIITEWRETRSLPPGVKTRALVVVAISFGASIVLVDATPLRLALALVAVVLVAFLLRIPTRR
jgi:hypothetical protein